MDILHQLGLGAILSLVYQMAKGEFHPYLDRILAVAVGAGGGYVLTNDATVAAITAVVALATHSVLLSGTPLGKVLKLKLLPRVLAVVAGLLGSLATAFQNAQDKPS